jgi:hypothetical protein
MSEPIEGLLSRLNDIKQTGQHQWEAKCPAHDDRRASLSICHGDDGIVLLKCHAGCNVKEITTAVGLAVQDLFPPKTGTSASKPKLGRIVKAYDYRDADGTLLYQVCRFDPKNFRQRKPDGNGGWSWKLDNVPRVLYHLPELLAAPRDSWVFIVEGEKDADNLVAVGLVATTCPQGAGKWFKLSDDSALHGRNVVIIPDNDKPGRDHAADVAHHLHGKAAEIRIVELPDLPEHGDVSDWVATGGSVGELMDLVGRAQSIGRYQPADVKETTTKIRPAYFSATDLMAQFPQQKEPIIEGLLRRGEVANLVSSPKMFKSWTLLYLAVCVVFGRTWLKFQTRPGRVLYLDYELAGGTLAKRLSAVTSAMGVTVEDLGDALAIETLRGRRLDVNAMRGYLDALATPFDLVVVDPLYKCYPREFDENSNAQLAEIFGTLQAYADRLNAGIVVVHHLTKGDQSLKAVTDLGAGGGSQARAADAHLAIRSHAEDDAAVLSGVVRSFPPFDPFCMRWQFPVWYVDDLLDPTDLRQPIRRTRKVVEQPAEPPEPPKPEWNVERFVEQFIRPEPQPRPAIVGAAMTEGIAEKRALKLLEYAEAAGKAHRWVMPKDPRAHFASTTQPILNGISRDDDGVSPPPPSPPYPPMDVETSWGAGYAREREWSTRRCLTSRTNRVLFDSTKAH